MTKDFHVWEGVFESFEKAPTIGKGFESKTWINRSSEKIKELIKTSEQQDSYLFDNTPLYSIASTVYAEKKSLKILDFGGGMGNTYIPLKTVLPENENLEFVVVEGEENVNTAEKIFENDKSINFLTDLPKNKYFDIIHISSSLQYIDNWKSLIKALSQYNAKYFIFTDLPVGKIEKSYVSLQNYYDSKIACNFFKFSDIQDSLSNNQYSLIYQSNFQANILQINKHYPQENFEKKFRINHSKNLVFRSF